MKYAEYVITGWVLTGATLGAYWLWIVRRTRSAEASWRESHGSASVEPSSE
ncbi:MAG: hypothetical protein ABWY80_05235 [Acidimicrobiia bacterium]